MSCAVYTTVETPSGNEVPLKLVVVKKESPQSSVAVGTFHVAIPLQLLARSTVILEGQLEITGRAVSSNSRVCWHVECNLILAEPGG